MRTSPGTDLHQFSVVISRSIELRDPPVSEIRCSGSTSALTCRYLEVAGVVNVQLPERLSFAAIGMKQVVLSLRNRRE